MIRLMTYHIDITDRVINVLPGPRQSTGGVGFSVGVKWLAGVGSLFVRSSQTVGVVSLFSLPHPASGWDQQTTSPVTEAKLKGAEQVSQVRN